MLTLAQCCRDPKNYVPPVLVQWLLGHEALWEATFEEAAKRHSDYLAYFIFERWYLYLEVRSEFWLFGLGGPSPNVSDVESTPGGSDRGPERYGPLRFKRSSPAPGRLAGGGSGAA